MNDAGGETFFRNESFPLAAADPEAQYNPAVWVAAQVGLGLSFSQSAPESEIQRSADKQRHLIPSADLFWRRLPNSCSPCRLAPRCVETSLTLGAQIYELSPRQHEAASLPIG
jgi:hypothetical protein